MKNNRKALLLVLCAVMMITASVFGTLAYLTDTKTATNTFTVGSVTITLDETDVDTMGVQDGENRVTENEYHLLPGKEYKKDPIVHLAATNDDCYVFVKVDNGLANIEADAGDGYVKIATQIADHGWAPLDGETGVYWQLFDKDAAVKDYDLEVFDKFKIKGTVDNDTLAAYKTAKITITAYAIQAQGFDDEEAAWDAGNVTQANGGWIKESTNP